MLTYFLSYAGLGKTMQVLAFIEILYRYTSIQTVVVVVPVSVINQWIEEFNLYIPQKHRKFNVYSQKSTFNDWIKTGGVLLIGYENIRTVLSTKSNEDLRKQIQNTQLLVFDEGHRLKNQQSCTTEALSSIACKRKIILTGYPLQNHLLEYWTMVNVVKPNYLLAVNDFIKIFKKPIEDGQYIDSTNDQITLMNRRCRLLHSLLEPIIQRRTNAVLLEQLPMKTEYVIFIRMTEIQLQLYNTLMKCKKQMPLLSIAAFCRKILNHPDLLHLKDDIDDNADIQEILDVDNENEKVLNSKGTTNWFVPHMTNYQKNLIENSPKMEVLMSIILDTFSTDDKIIVFSLSTATLNLIEHYLQSKLQLTKGWQYLRIDGKTTLNKRIAALSEFNLNPKMKLMLLSTKSCSLGLNLVVANRVVLFDPSWNPCDDQQASSRVYRFGQKKPTFIYRFIVDKSFELAVLNRQINKINMSDRIVDEAFPNNQFTVQKLSLFEEIEQIEQYNFCSEENSNTFIHNIIEKFPKLISKPPEIYN